MEVGGKREISPVPFSLSLPPSFPPFLSLSLPLSVGSSEAAHSHSRFLRSSVPLSSRFIRCVGRAWGVTNPSRIRIAAPTVGIRRAIGPNDTRKPNGKRKYESRLPVRETNSGNSRSRRTAPGFRLLVSARFISTPYPPKGGTRASSSLSVSSLSLPLHSRGSLSPHLFAVTFQWWKLDDWSRDGGLGFIGRPPFPCFRGKVENVLSLVSPASSLSGVLLDKGEGKGEGRIRDRIRTRIRARFVSSKHRSSIAAI